MEAGGRVVLGVGSLFLLACGGAGGGLVGSSASQRAQDLCTHLDGANADKYNPGVSCVAMGVGSKPVAEGIQVEVISFRRVEGKDSLPDIQNYDERNKFKKNGNNAVAVEIEYTNTSPVRSGIEARVALQSGGGEQLFTWPYNSKVVMAASEGTYMDLWERPELGPDQKKRSIHVFTLPAGDEPNSVLQVYSMENRVDTTDPRGRKKDFFTSYVILDLPPLQEE